MAARYHFTVQGENSLMEAAGQSLRETDHIVELQLVVAALNTLPDTTYTREGWERELVDFFDDPRNLQKLTRDENREKSQAVRRFIREGAADLDEEDKEWIRSIHQHWSDIRHYLTNYVRFKKALDDMLNDV